MTSRGTFEYYHQLAAVGGRFAARFCEKSEVEIQTNSCFARNLGVEFSN